MTVQHVPGEPTRFWVSSESRPGMEHLVDFDWRDEKWHKPRALCGCEEVQCKGTPICKHILAVLAYLKSA